jgi:hypothetical protein
MKLMMTVLIMTRMMRNDIYDVDVDNNVENNESSCNLDEFDR